MKILVVGHGWVGQKITSELLMRGHIVSQSSHKVVYEYLDTHEFNWVINCAGITGVPNVDACELDKHGTLVGNAIFPISLAEHCRAKQLPLSHFSSGCIYEGDITDVNAAPNFHGSIYSISKGISDTYLKTMAQVYRIRMPFTGVDEPKNYLSKVLKYAKTGKLIDYGQNSLTDLDEAVRVASDLIEARAPNGPYNLVNDGSVNMHELAELLKISPEWYTPEEFQHVTAAGRSTCTIPAYKHMSPVRDALLNAIGNMHYNI